jgi:hypothetical protein
VFYDVSEGARPTVRVLAVGVKNRTSGRAGGAEQARCGARPNDWESVELSGHPEFLNPIERSHAL